MPDPATAGQNSRKTPDMRRDRLASVGAHLVSSMIGQTISHYRIIEKLGEGGMGVVYKAEDTKLKRTVALKFLTTQAVGSEEEKIRFIHEAQAAAALSHSNICTVYEIDESEGQSFIAMEYIEGQSLKEKIETGPLKLDEATDIAMQVSEGLQRAHEEGVVHRDIKSGNVMVTEGGQVKIMDFGLAKLTGQTKLTKTGTTVGTVAYMSPEQARGETIDHRTDIWSLGVVLYEMVTGQLPFKGEYEQAVVYSIMNEEPEPMTALRTGVPMELERITNKTLAKSPGERYQHGDEIEADLKILRKELETPGKIQPLKVGVEEPREKRFPKEPEQKPVWRLPAYVLAVLVLVVAGVVFYPTIFKDSSIPVEEQVDPKSVAVLPFSSITKTEDAESFTDGIHDDILTQLVKIRDLRVIARTSVIKYKNTDKRISEIGKELGVASVLEGSVRRAGGRIRIVSQLIDVKTDEHLWAETYDRDYTDIFAIQSDVAQKIAIALKATLTPEEIVYIEEKPTDNMEAYDYFLKGKHFWTTYATKEGNQKAVDMFDKATELDPNFTLAYAWASIVHSVFYRVLIWDHTQARKELAKSALDKALALDPDHPQVHYAKGVYQEWCLKDYNSALREYEIAFSGEPNNSEIAQDLGVIYMRSGNWEKAEETLLKAYELNPLGFNSAYRIGRFYLHQRQFDRAQHYLNLAIQSDPEQAHYYRRKAFNYLDGFGDIKKARSLLKEAEMNVPNPEYFLLAQFRTEIYARDYSKALSYAKERKKIDSGTLSVGRAYYYLGEEKLAQEEFESLRVYYEDKIEEEPENASFHSSLGQVYAYLGLKEKAVAAGKKGTNLLPVVKDHYAGPDRVSSLAIIYILTGEQELAIESIEYLLSIPGFLTRWNLRLNPVFDPIRDNPRFQQLIEVGT